MIFTIIDITSGLQADPLVDVLHHSQTNKKHVGWGVTYCGKLKKCNFCSVAMDRPPCFCSQNVSLYGARFLVFLLLVASLFFDFIYFP